MACEERNDGLTDTCGGATRGAGAIDDALGRGGLTRGATARIGRAHITATAGGRASGRPPLGEAPARGTRGRARTRRALTLAPARSARVDGNARLCGVVVSHAVASI